ncbi:ornithine cyclodeaminase family protein [Algimonas porphyrae]|uniref:Ornithine cyclodeaminase n=1 Tax=Algimonas porphyrae TaxID=1128113 RepID=A0ABQ5V4T6_9PROT|nr:ornithine cyclodeaminase family protein [Algimonas porphyrae]GLQ21292.1 ornithine cyclodeaminase [Algimonas porphyrae]
MSMPDSPILIIDETMARQAVSRADAFLAVKNTFAAMAAGQARNFPVTREALEDQAALFGFKSGYDAANGSLGLKAGGYWSKNSHQGLDNHQSSVLLFEPKTGRLEAVVSGNYLTATRTAAASAVSIDLLAREDSKTLSIVGSGKQAESQIQAALDIRDFQIIHIANRTREKAERLADTLRETGLEIFVSSIEQACRQADVLITIVSAFEPVVQTDWIKMGTHIAAMGTDTVGKQELDPALFGQARIYADEIPQSAHLGEAQHAVQQGILSSEQITAIGEAINDPSKGRQTESEITLFDGTGVGLQDLAVARLAVAHTRRTAS